MGKYESDAGILLSTIDFRLHFKHCTSPAVGDEQREEWAWTTLKPRDQTQPLCPTPSRSIITYSEAFSAACPGTHYSFAFVKLQTVVQLHSGFGDRRHVLTQGRGTDMVCLPKHTTSTTRFDINRGVLEVNRVTQSTRFSQGCVNILFMFESKSRLWD